MVRAQWICGLLIAGGCATTTATTEHAPPPPRLARATDAATPAPDLQQRTQRAYAWARQGETAFDEGTLELAEQSYSRALAELPPGDSLRGVLVYKLAWTSYRRDRNAEALDRFTALLDLRDPGAAASLRPEAIQYLAVLVSEDDWDVDGRPDSHLGFDRPEVAAWRSRVASAPWLPSFHAELARAYDQLLLPARAAEARDLAP